MSGLKSEVENVLSLAMIAMRDKPGARRASSLHWVEEHWRKNRKDPDALIRVRAHMRGRTRFEWDDSLAHETAPCCTCCRVAKHECSSALFVIKGELVTNEMGTGGAFEIGWNAKGGGQIAVLTLEQFMNLMELMQFTSSKMNLKAITLNERETRTKR